MKNFVGSNKLTNRKSFDDLKQGVQKKNAEVMLVVGNGPSLRSSDLSALSCFPSVASNKIYLLYGQTHWRPDVYTIHDPLLAYKLRGYNFEEVPRVLCSNSIYYMLSSLTGRKTPWVNVPLDNAEKALKDKGEFKPDPLRGLFEGYSVTVQNVQLAMWLGAKKIYLIGIDHSYNEESSSKIGKKMEHKVTSHFHSEYRQKGEIVNNASINKMNHAYNVLNDVAKASGVEIINISRNTKLNVFPKLPIDDLLESMI